MDGRDRAEPDLKQVVRRYSLKVAEEMPDDIISQALGATAQRDIAKEQRQRERPHVDSWEGWLQVLEPCSDRAMVRLEKQKKRVAAKWKLFHSDSGLGDLFSQGGPPSIDTVLQTVQGAEQTWNTSNETGFGKAKSALDKFLNSMNSHSYMFSVIPNGDKYTSLITGIVTSVVKASVNHRKIAELFSAALEDIAKDLETVPGSIKISDSKKMRLLVVDLYFDVFDFLCAAMDWYEKRSRRFRAAFNQDYINEVNKTTTAVKSVLTRIKHEADQATQVRIQDTQHKVTNVQKGVDNVQQELKGVQQEVTSVGEGVTRFSQQLTAVGDRARERGIDVTKRLEELSQSVSILMLGQRATLSLLATGQATIYNQKIEAMKSLTIEGRKSLSSPQVLHVSDVGSREDLDNDGIYEDSADILFTYGRDEIQEIAAPYLNVYLQDGRSEVLTTTSTMSKALLPAEVTQKISRWIGDPSSAFLWVEGPVYLTAERQLSLAAVRICDTALNARNPVPCVSFTPKSRFAFHSGPLSDSSLEPVASRQEQVLISMLYSVAGQLLPLLPEELDSTTERFDAQVFEILDGSPASASAALDLIESLLAYSPPTLIVIVDKLQQAECPATATHLERFVSLLKGRAPSQIIKALFVTSGKSRVLAKTLDIKKEKVDARRMVQSRPGQPLRGWSSLGNLKLPNQAP